MRQTLFYIPIQIFGIPVFGLGIAFFLLLFVLLIAAGWRFAKTRKIDEEIWSYLGLLIVGGAILLFVVPNLVEPDGFPIRSYGACLLVAILAALTLVLKLAKRKGISTELIFSLCLWAVISGILGARLFYVVEYWPDMVAKDLAGNILIDRTAINVVNIANGGLVVLGSILGGALGSIVFMIRNKMPVLATFDLMAPAMMLGLAFGRIGCFMNGCCYGGVTDGCCGVVFPEDSPAHIHQILHGETFLYGMRFDEKKSENGKSQVVLHAVQPDTEAFRAGLESGMILLGITGLVHGKPEPIGIATREDLLRTVGFFQHENPGKRIRFEFVPDPPDGPNRVVFLEAVSSPVLPVHPTQIYSSVAAAILCVVLLILGRTKWFRSRDGLSLTAFLLLYSVTRFCLEMIRTDEDSFMGTGLTVSQNVSVVVFLTGCVLLVYLLKRPSIRKPASAPPG